MNNRILCVDDEPGILVLGSLHLKQDFDISFAMGSHQGLAILQESRAFAVIVSGLGMSEMNETQFLTRVQAAAPDSIRLLLTRDTDIRATIKAANDGSAFRFLTKPCERENLVASLRSGIEQYHLRTAEKELLERTLLGSIEVLTEVLSLVSPQAFGKASRIKRLVQQLAATLKVPNPWLLEIAAMLSQIGCVSIPDAILAKVYSGEGLTMEERAHYETHPRIGSDLIGKIPRLEEVSRIVCHQNRRFDNSHSGATNPPLGALVLKVALDCEELESLGFSRARALEQLKGRQGWYAPDVLDALEELSQEEARLASRVVPVPYLRAQMILAEDLVNKRGGILVHKGQEISAAMLPRLVNQYSDGAVHESVRVWIPTKLSQLLPKVSDTMTTYGGN